MVFGLQLPPDATLRVPLTGALFVRHVSPVFGLYTFVAFLARTPGTRALRFVLIPVTLPLAYHAAVSFQPSGGVSGYTWMDLGYCITMILISMRVIDWGLLQEPLRRTQPIKSTPLWDTLDLLINLRGIGWSYSTNAPIPPESRNVNSIPAFYTSTILRAVAYVTAYDGFHYIVQIWGPNSFGSAEGGSVFDPSLPQPWRYLRGTAISFVTGLAILLSLDMMYYCATLFCLPILPPWSPHGWPPLSNLPWCADSLRDLWGARWHQSFRRTFIILGSVPLALVAGRRVAPLGAFFVSGLLHDFGSWGLGQGTDPWRAVGFFVLMGVGCVLESLWSTMAGRKVGGWQGRIWTLSWVAGWCNLLVETWLVRGLAGSIIIPPRWRLGKMIVDLAIGFLGI